MERIKNKSKLEEMMLFTNREACKILRVSPITLWRERKKGNITFRRISGKIVYLRQDLTDYLEARKRGGFGEQNQEGSI